MISNLKTQFVVMTSSSRIETLKRLREISPFFGVVYYKRGNVREGVMWVNRNGLRGHVLSLKADKEFKVNLEKVERIEIKASMSTNLDGYRRALISGGGDRE